MQPVVFSTAWFRRHQRTLLRLLNAPIIGGEFRAALGVSAPSRIVALLPHAVVWANDDGSYTMDCRTHRKFAKRLRHQFDPIWRAAHAWDRFVANPLVPALNVGFDSLTVYPDPGVPGTTSCDGALRHISVDVAWGTLIAAAGNNVIQNGTTEHAAFFSASTTTDQWKHLGRAAVLFDTAAIGASSTITAAVLSIFGSAKVDANGLAPNVDVYTVAPASNTTLGVADFSTFGSTSQTGAPITFANWSTSAYNDFTLDSTGRGNVSKTGISKFGTRNANYDVAAVAPAWFSNDQTQLTMHFADQTGSANDPKLVVTYNGPAQAGTAGFASWQSVIVAGS